MEVLLLQAQMLQAQALEIVAAVAAGLDAVAATISAGDKAHYYPGSRPTTAALAPRVAW